MNHDPIPYVTNLLVYLLLQAQDHGISLPCNGILGSCPLLYILLGFIWYYRLYVDRKEPGQGSRRLESGKVLKNNYNRYYAVIITSITSSVSASSLHGHCELYRLLRDFTHLLRSRSLQLGGDRYSYRYHSVDNDQSFVS